MSAAMTFGSDNHAGIVPEVLAAIAEANVGHASGYGDDQWTEQAEALLGNAFGDAAFALCLTGTGSNVVALSLALRGWESVLTAEGAHIDLDEAGAPERITGSKLETIASSITWFSGSSASPNPPNAGRHTRQPPFRRLPIGPMPTSCCCMSTARGSAMPRPRMAVGWGRLHPEQTSSPLG